MRKALAGLASALILATSAAPAVATTTEEEWTARREMDAWANWVLPTAKAGRELWLGVEVFSREGTDGPPRTGAFVIRGDCRKKGQMTMCMGWGDFIEGPDFEMAIDASSATASFRHRKKRFALEWGSNELLPSLYESEEYCMGPDDEEGVGYGAGIWRAATVTGHGFGRKLGAEGADDFTMLMTGAMATECDDYFPRMVARQGDRALFRWVPASSR